MNNKYWNILPETKNKNTVTLRDPEGWYEARIRWDGCVNYFKFFNIPLIISENEKDVDAIHICDIDDEIERLKALKDIAKEYFKDKTKLDNYWIDNEKS